MEQILAGIKECNERAVKMIAKEKGTAITQLSLDGKFIRTFYSLREVERIYPNINRRRVNDCAKGLIDSVCGYKWKFTNKEQ